MNSRYVLDSSEMMWFERQQELVKTKVYEVEFPRLKARTLFPIDNSGGNWANVVTYPQERMTGDAKIVNNYADDFPRTDIINEEFSHGIHSLGASYGWSIQDIRLAIKNGTNLQARKANSCKDAILRRENYIAFYGDSNQNIYGFLTEPNVPNIAVAADGTGSSPLWVDKTPDQIIRDITVLIKKIKVDTKDIEEADTLLLPVAQFSYLASTRLDASIETTILTWLGQQLRVQGITNIESVVELTGSGTGSTDQFVLYRRDPDKLVLNIPSDFEQFPVERKGMSFSVACHSRVGGIQFIRPLSAIKGYGI